MGTLVKENRPVSVLEQLQKLDEQRAKLLDGAKAEALGKAEAAIADLKAIGFDYQLVLAGTATKKASKSGITRQRDPNKPCDICGFATDPGHDGRVHRAQGEKKKPFTDKELKEKGYIKKA